VFYLFLLIVAALSVGLYLLFIFSQVPGIAEQRLGVLEPLPDDLGKWKVDSESPPEANFTGSEGVVREVRLVFHEGRGFSAGKLVRQVRYRSATGEIVRVEPEREIKRRRLKKSA
jgi:hypothetical protein